MMSNYIYLFISFTLQESFFLAETVKYLYLLFDPKNFIHSEGDDVTVVDTPRGKCTVYAGGYIFNTEAHPIDPSALNCCTGVAEADLHKEIQVIDEVRSSRVFSALKKAKAHAQDSSKRRKRKKKKTVDYNNDAVNNNNIIITENIDTSVVRLPSLAKNELEKLFADQNIIQLDKSERINPFLQYRNKQSLSYSPVVQYSLNLSSIPPMQTVTSDSDNLVFKLLKKLLDEQPDYKEVVRKEFANGVEKGLQFETGKQDKDLRKLVEKFETNLKAAEETDLAKRRSLAIKQESGTVKGSLGTATIIKQDKNNENRIRSKSPIGETNPDLDLIFGTSTTSRSLSFYFSLKWLPAFPDLLLRQLMPSESFDIQNFYSRMGNEFSSQNFSKRFNFSEAWLDNFDVLRCPSLKMADRFMFFRSSVED